MASLIQLWENLKRGKFSIVDDDTKVPMRIGPEGLASISDFIMEVRKGNIPKHSVTSFVGRNETVGTTFETVWEEGGLYVFPSAGAQMTLSSSDANDTSAGSGLRTSLLTYLDDNWVQQTETITLNGQTGVNTVATDIFRIVSIVGLTAGATGSNEGIVYIGTGSITAGKPDVVNGLMTIGHNISQHGFFTIPDAQTGFLLSVTQGVDANKDVTNRLSRQTETGLKLLPVSLTVLSGLDQLFVLTFTPFAAHEDITIESKIPSSTAEVSIILALLLVDD